MIDYEQPLPLIPNSDQINTIKPLNRWKHEEHDAEMSVEEARIERFENEGV